MADQTKDLETVRVVKTDLSKNAFERASTFFDNAKRPGYNVSDYLALCLRYPFNAQNSGIDESQLHDSTIVPALKLVEAEVLPDDSSRARTVFDLKVIPTLCNGTGNLHGGAVALIFGMSGIFRSLRPFFRPDLGSIVLLEVFWSFAGALSMRTNPPNTLPFCGYGFAC